MSTQTQPEIPKAGDRIKFSGIPLRGVVLDANLSSAWQTVPSKEVVKHTMAPDFPVLVCIAKLKPEGQEPGTVAEDFFGQDFFFVGTDMPDVTRKLAKLKATPFTPKQ